MKTPTFFLCLVVLAYNHLALAGITSLSLSMPPNYNEGAIFFSENPSVSTLSTTQQQITDFVLVSAHTEQDLMPLADGQVISLASLSSTKLNIRANTSPATVGSVKFELSGAQSKTYTDNAAPYALHGDNGSGNYYFGNWNPPATGTYTLRATPYSGAKATGTAGTPLTITFTVVKDGGTPTTQYTLTTATVGSGTVSRSPNQSAYDAGSTVTLTATPASGSRFVGWTGDASGSQNPLAVTMTSSKSITAVFESLQSDTYALSVSTVGNGSVAKSPDQTSYTAGTTVTLTATPQTGSQFAGWSGDASGTTNPLQLTVDRSKSVTATFTAISTSGPQVTGFTLVNAATEQDIQEIANGATISLTSLPTSKLNIRANTSPGAVGSVKFELSGAQSKTYTDNAAPYALHGDDGAGNYYYGNWNPPATGTYTLRATPYSGSKATGTAGTPLTITFTVVQDGGTPTDMTPPEVVSINRHSPSTSTTSASTVIYRVTFSESVTEVDVTDFATTITAGSLSTNLNSVTPVSAEGKAYDVSVSITEGSGTVRLDLKGSGTGIKDLAGNGILAGYTSGQTYTIQAGQTTEGFVSVKKLQLAPTHINLGDQPQSKVWQYNGKWWAVFPTTGNGTHIWRLDGDTWTVAQTISPSTSTRADCKVVGNLVHILLYRGSRLDSELVSVEFDATQNTYKPWSERTSRVSLILDPLVKTATIDVDTDARMWLAYNGSNNAYVRWSDFPYTDWSSPITVASGLTDDDICAVIAMPSAKKIGVLWSNQNTKRFGFKTHNDGASPDTWSLDEVPASQSALDDGDGMADDHINMAIASDGTLYCAVKTGYRGTNPRIALLVRRPSGAWDNLYEVSQAGNRPIVILNEAMGKVKVIYAAPNAGGIYYKESSTSSIAFGSELLLINEICDYATSSKATYSDEIVIFASTNKEAYSVLASDAKSSLLSGASASASLRIEDSQKSFSAYPNPFDGKTTLHFTMENGGDYEVVLYDKSGKNLGKLVQGKSEAGGQIKYDWDAADLPSGLYLVRLIAPGKTSTFKLMLNR